MTDDEPILSPSPEGESVPQAVTEALERTIQRTEELAHSVVDPVAATLTSLDARVGAIEARGVGEVTPRTEDDIRADEPAVVTVEHEVERGPLRVIHDAIG